MSDPFESPDAHYWVLLNDEERSSLWPAFADVPAGWRPVLGPGPREQMIAHINASWLDMRPKSLRDEMDGKFPEPKKHNQTT